MKFGPYHLALSVALGLFAFSSSTQAQGAAGYLGGGHVAGKIASAFSRQNLEPADQATTKRIRDSITTDQSLSVQARRIQISTSHGRVTLLGDVQSDGEKSAILAKAKAVVGDGNVENRLSITPTKS
jgi:osmotically-inducible protein OsmY